MARPAATFAAAVAAALLVVGVGLAALYQNPIYLFLVGGPALVLLVAVGLLGMRGRRGAGAGPQS